MDNAVGEQLRSSLCKEADLVSPAFRAWALEMKENPEARHRKLWEYCFIAQALFERGCLATGRKGLGFAVGQEPLVALFASRGCEVVASDLDLTAAKTAGWVDTNQHAADRESLNGRGICDPEKFRRAVSFRNVDMNHIPRDLREFDFVWSSCSLEHLGSISHGEWFMYRALECLKVGGIAVHTTEYNLSSNIKTIDNEPTVLFRKRDIERIVARLSLQGHELSVDLTEGTSPADVYIDVAPYAFNPHLRLSLLGHVTTSVGLIIQKGTRSNSIRAAVQFRVLGVDGLMIRSALIRSSFGRGRRFVGRIVSALRRR